jgi:diguanylate cyclase (GGDEF)-like protein
VKAQISSGSQPGESSVLLDRQGKLFAAHGPDIGNLTEATIQALYQAAVSNKITNGGIVMTADHTRYVYHWVGDTGWLLADPIPRSLLLRQAVHGLSPGLLVMSVLVAALLLTSLWLLSALFSHQLQMQKMLSEMAQQDPLTGLSNRRHFNGAFETAWQLRGRENKPLALVSLDIDFFKHINDHWGHASGDAVIRMVAQLCRGGARPADIVARMGGEEFAILLADTTRDEAASLAERMRETMAEARCAPADKDGEPMPDADPIRFSASFGVAEAGEDGAATPAALLALADARLYAAKHGGRNRVVAHDEPPQDSTAQA